MSLSTAIRRFTLATSVGATIAALCLETGGCGRSMPPSYPHALEDKPMPQFQHRALDGSMVDTHAVLGHVVVIKFFAKYCAPCRRTLPALEAIHERRDDLVVIGVAEDDALSDANAVVSQYGLTFPVIHDGGQQLSGRFGVSAIPITFLVDRAGSVFWVGGPEATDEDLRAAIDAAP